MVDTRTSVGLQWCSFSRKPSNRGADCASLNQQPHGQRWEALYRCIPDEQPDIEACLIDLVRS